MNPDHLIIAQGVEPGIEAHHLSGNESVCKPTCTAICPFLMRLVATRPLPWMPQSLTSSYKRSQAWRLFGRLILHQPCISMFAKFHYLLKHNEEGAHGNANALPRNPNKNSLAYKSKTLAQKLPISRTHRSRLQSLRLVPCFRAGTDFTKAGLLGVGIASPSSNNQGAFTT